MDDESATTDRLLVGNAADAVRDAVDPATALVI